MSSTVQLRFCGVHRQTVKAVGINDECESMVDAGRRPLVWIPKVAIKRIEKQHDSFGFYHEIEVYSWFFNKNQENFQKFIDA